MPARRSLLTLLLVLCAAAAALAAPVLTCTRDLGPGAGSLDTATPTDVAVDPGGILYILYGREGRMDLVRSDGTPLQQRGQSGATRPPAKMNPVNLWVGSWAGPALLASEVGQSSPEWLLRLRQGRLQAQKLTGASLGSPAVVALGPDGRSYVLCGQVLHVFGPTGALQYRTTLAGASAPRALAVDSRRNAYVLEGSGLRVYGPKGNERYAIEGARAFSLASDDRMVAAGGSWVRKYSTKGQLLVGASEVEGSWGRQVMAASLAEDGGMFVYYRDPASGGGLVVRLDPRGDVLEEFVQPARFPSGGDPGIRLDGRGRIHLWDGSTGALVKLHPGGREELRTSYAPAADVRGTLSRPSDLAVDSDGVVWVADTGNFRLQRFYRDEGWLRPVPVGIRGGPDKGEPRQVAVDGRGAVLAVVHPPSGRGQIVLQRRDRQGRLLSQTDLGEAAGSPVVKLAVGNDGSVFLYRSDARLALPVLTRLDSRGRTVARVGGDDRNFHLPGNFATQISLKPEEDMIPWKGGVLLPVGGRLAVVDAKLQVREVLDVRHKRSADLRTSPDYGGGAISGGRVLYLADLANAVVHRIPLEGR